MGSCKSIANASTCCRGEFHEERTAWDTSLLSPRAEGPFEVLAGLGRQCLFGPTVKGLATVQPCHLQQLQKAAIPPSPSPGCPGGGQARVHPRAGGDTGPPCLPLKASPEWGESRRNHEQAPATC